MNTIVSVRRYQYAAERCNLSSPYWSLIFCTDGESEYGLADGTYLVCKAGNVVVIPPNICYNFRPSEKNSGIRIFLSHPAFQSVNAFIVSDNASHFLKASFEQAWDCSCRETPHKDNLLDSLGSVIVNYIIALNTEMSYTSPVRKIYDLILQNYTQCDFSLDDAMRQMPFHYDYLRKRFKSEVGFTPREYLTELRMEKARSMLSGSGAREYNVSEVAQQCGFDDPLYFSRIFKKYFGICPSAYSKGNTQSNWQNHK